MIDKIKEVAHKLKFPKTYGIDGQPPNQIEKGFNYCHIAMVIDTSQIYYKLDVCIYQLIFDKEIGFIEALVGEGRYCERFFRKQEDCDGYCPDGETGDPINCGELIPTAHYHRRCLATMTLDEMIEYINNEL
jgi:hypothetical protein